MNKFVVFLLLISTGFWQISFTQVKQVAAPIGWMFDTNSAILSYDFPNVDKAEQLYIDSLNAANGYAYENRFGYEHHTTINVLDQEHIVVANDTANIFMVEIICPGAVSINVIFDSFQLSDGVEVSLYAADYSSFIGAYTSKNNNVEQVLGTELIKSDHIVLEAYVPKTVDFLLNKLLVGTVVHGYLSIDDLIAAEVTRNLNASGNCNFDVNCPQGQGWEKQRNSVVRIMKGGGYCSGSLIHNTSGEIIPYILTANHCTFNAPSAASWVYRFRWEAPVGGTSCATSSPSADGPTNMVINGSTIRANDRNADFLLLELFQAPEITWGIYYNGWDRRENVTFSETTTIHHPRGDIKKIARSFMSPTKEEIPFNGNPDTKVWRVNNWSEGVTEQSSSGAPLFNENKKVIGVLSAGTAACAGTINNNGFDVFGRFGVAWNDKPTPANNLMAWLDPTGTGIEVLEGIDPNEAFVNLDAELTTLDRLDEVICGALAYPKITVTNRGKLPLTSLKIDVNLNGLALEEQTWSGYLETGFSAEIWLPGLPTLAGQNVVSVRLFDPNDSVDENTDNDELSITFLSAKDGEYIQLNGHLDCFASEVSWQIEDEQNNIWHTSNSFQNLGNVSQLIDTSYCLAEGCYALVIFDDFGDGWLGSERPSCSYDGSLLVQRSTNSAVLTQIDESNVQFGTELNLAFCAENTAQIPAEEALHKDGLFQVYPNPTNGTFQIDYLGQHFSAAEVSLFNAQGKRVALLLLESSVTKVNLNLQNGFYTLQISANGRLENKKLMIVR